MTSWRSCSPAAAAGAVRLADGRFGVSWQIVPRMLHELIGDEDPAKAKRALDAMLKMQKLDIAALRRAHAGEEMVTPRT